MLLKKQILNMLIKTSISLIFLIISILLLKNENTYYQYHKILFENNIDFAYIRSKTNYLFGKIILNKEKYVSSEKFRYYNIIKNDNYYQFEVDHNYVINNLKSGVVCFIGNKEELGNTVIIEGDDGLTISYSNLENININLYDYIEEGIIIGNTVDNTLILSFKKGEEYISYENII